VKQKQQQNLTESTRRNVEERIRAIQDGGDGYMTVLTVVETKCFLECSNLQNGVCKINPKLPELLGCSQKSICGFKDFYHAE